MRLLVVAPDLGVGPDGSIRPGGVAAMGRTVVSALARAPEVGPLLVWSLLDHRRRLGPALAARDAALPAEALRGFGGARLALAAALRRARKEVDHVMFLHLGPARLAPLLGATPWSVWLHGIEAWGPLRSTRRRALAGAARRLAVSAHTASRAAAANPWLPPVEVVPLGLGPEGVPAAAAVPAAPPSRRPPQVLMVARMSAAERYKGHEQAFAAWPLVRARVPAARLLVVGGGDDAERLRRLAGPGIEMLGEVPDRALADLHAESRAFLLPSTGEGFGLVFLEAMRSGTPCVASAGAPAEVVAADETGLLVAQEPSAIAAAVVDLLLDDGRADRMGAAGQRRYAERFAFGPFRERLRAVVRTLPRRAVPLPHHDVP